MIFGSFLLHFASFSPVPCIQLAQARFGACLRSKVTSHRHTPSIWCWVDVELHWFPYCVWILASWYCIPSTCFILFDRSRCTYSCIVDHRVAFQMPFLTKKTQASQEVHFSWHFMAVRPSPSKVAPQEIRGQQWFLILKLRCSFLQGYIGGLGWTNMNLGPHGQEHQTHWTLPSLLHSDLLTSLHTQEVMPKRSAFDTSHVRFSLTKPLGIPF